MPEEQTYRIEIRFDYTTDTKERAIRAAQEAAHTLEGEVTAVWDENWDDVF